VVRTFPPSGNAEHLRAGIRSAFGAGDEREVINLGLQLIQTSNVTNSELMEMAAIARKWLEPGLALSALRRLHKTNPGNVTLLLDLAANEQFMCRPADALRHLEDASSKCRSADDFLRLGLVRQRLGEVEAALEAFRHASAADTANLDARFNIALCLGYVGEVQEAEDICTDLIQRGYKADETCLHRSWLKRQTQDANHVSELRVLGDAPNVLYALAKELEDLGEKEEALATYVKAAAGMRRSLANDDASVEVERAKIVRRNFTANVLGAPAQGCPTKEPIFVISMPRAGSTLVERILGRHPDVAALGEIEYLHRLVNFAAVSAARTARAPKTYYPEWITQLDFQKIGEDYVKAARAHAGDAPRFVDKLPENYVNVGLIARALPAATIVHVRRNPMDACFAMFRQAFAQGHMFTYDLAELAQAYIAYRQLMDHWDEVLPGKIVHLDYDALVADPEPITRQLLNDIGLDWNDAVLDVTAEGGLSKSASAIQVRSPIYRSSVGRWREAEAILAPLQKALENAGIEVD